MPLIHNFQSTSIIKAFILYSITASLTIFVAMVVKEKFDKYVKDKDGNLHRETTAESTFITLMLTFLVSMITLGIMYLIFGYGGGFLVS